MFVAPAYHYEPLPAAIKTLMSVSFSASQCLEGLDIEAFGDDRDDLWQAFWERLVKEYNSPFGGGKVFLDGPNSWYETRGGLRFGILTRDHGWGLQGRPWIRRPRPTAERPDNGTLRAAALAAGWEEVPDEDLPRLQAGKE